jgi:gas vesicle protein
MMMTETRGRGLQCLVAFATGAAAGCAIAYLTAPRTGRETREALQFWTRDIRDKASRLPQATRAALERGSRAGREAFAESYRQDPTRNYE